MNEKTGGLSVSIYDYYGCEGSLKGVSRAVLIHPSIPSIFEPKADAPALYLTRWFGGWRATPEPVSDNKPSRFADGGRFAYTSDSRLPSLPNEECPSMPHKLPIPIHDLPLW